MQAHRRLRRGYWIMVGTITMLFLVGYILVEALQVPFLTGTPELTAASVPTALIAIGLLVADILLPVPSSLVMVACGALFGFWTGTAIALAGNVVGFVFAYWLGYRTSPLIQKAVSLDELRRGNNVLRKWGVTALILTRPLPILAETTAIMAGVARVPFGKSLTAVVAGVLPIVALYAWAGAHAKGFSATAVIFVALAILAAIAWKIDKAMQGESLASLIKVARPRQKQL